MKSIAIFGVLLIGCTVCASAQTRPANPSRPSSPAAPLPKGFFSINGIYQVTTNDFDDGATFRENAEDGRYDTDYTVKGGPAVDVAGGMRLWRNLAVGAGVTRFSRSTPVALSGSIPHPFFFSRPRTISGEIANLKREELAVHVQARGVMPVGRRLQVMVFGGPSFFQVKQGVVTDFTYQDTYPYDTATFASAETTTAKESKLGFNAGGDVAFFFTRRLGVGVSAQFSGTEIDVPSASGQTQTVRIGGLQAGGGLRVRF